MPNRVPQGASTDHLASVITLGDAWHGSGTFKDLHRSSTALQTMKVLLWQEDFGERRINPKRQRERMHQNASPQIESAERSPSLAFRGCEFFDSVLLGEDDLVKQTVDPAQSYDVVFL